MKEYPQININIMTDKKDDIAKDSELLALVTRLSANLGDFGRTFVRASGTENKLRITAECADTETAQSTAKELESFVKDKYKI